MSNMCSNGKTCYMFHLVKMPVFLGLFNIRFTKYVVEEPMATETMTTTTNIKTEEDPEIQVIPQKNGATQSPQIKEREL